MKTARQHTRDRYEDRCERAEKLGQAMDTLPGKTLRDRLPAAGVRDHPRSKAERFGNEDASVSPAPTQRAPRAGVTAALPTARFFLFAPNAASVFVAGSFNAWDAAATPLKKGTAGSWQIEMELRPGTYEYRFVVDGNWQEDPSACDSVENPYGTRNSIKHVA